MPSFTIVLFVVVALCAGIVVDAFNLQRSALHQIRMPTKSARLYAGEVRSSQGLSIPNPILTLICP